MVFGVGLNDDASLSLSRCFSFLAVVSWDSPFFSSLYVLLFLSLLSTITTFPFPFLALSLSFFHDHDSTKLFSSSPFFSRTFEH